MTYANVMARLEAAGAEQTRKTYRRHGMPEPMFGVSFAILGTLAKQLKRDHALALALWASGNLDARFLATMVAEPARCTPDLLDAWVRSAGGHTLASYAAGLARHGPLDVAVAQAEAWIADPAETVQRAGWSLVAELALADAAPPDGWLDGLLPRIEAAIHAAANRAKEGMNSALIAIGTRDDRLEGLAIAAARRIGKVEVDHGDTACKTPLAEPYILKSRAHRREQAAKAAAKLAAKATAKPAAKAAAKPAGQP